MRILTYITLLSILLCCGTNVLAQQTAGNEADYIKNLVVQIKSGTKTQMNPDEIRRLVEYAMNQNARAYEILQSGHLQEASDTAIDTLNLLKYVQSETYGTVTYARAISYSIIGLALAKANRPADALDMWKEAAKRYEVVLHKGTWARLDDKVALLPHLEANYDDLLRNMARFYEALGNYEKATQSLKDSFLMHQDLDNAGGMLRSSELLLEWARRLQKLTGPHTDKKAQALSKVQEIYALNYYSVTLRRLRRYTESLNQAKIAVSLAEDVRAVDPEKGEELWVNSATIMGNALQGLGRHEEALRVLNSVSDSLRSKQGSESTRFAILERVVSSFISLGRYASVIPVLREQLLLAEKQPDRNLAVAHVHNNLASALYRLERTDAAEAEVRLAIEALKREPYSNANARLLRARYTLNLAGALTGQGHAEESMKLLPEALSLLEDMPNTERERAKIHLEFHRALMVLNRSDEARKHLEQGLAALEGADNVDDLRMTLEQQLAARDAPEASPVSNRCAKLVAHPDDVRDADLEVTKWCLMTAANNSGNQRHWDEAKALRLKLLTVIDRQIDNLRTGADVMNRSELLSQKKQVLASLGVLHTMIGEYRESAERLLQSMKLDFEPTIVNLLGLSAQQKSTYIRKHIEGGTAEYVYGLTFAQKAVPASLGFETALIYKDLLAMTSRQEREILFSQPEFAKPAQRTGYLDLRREVSRRVLLFQDDLDPEQTEFIEQINEQLNRLRRYEGLVQEAASTSQGKKVVSLPGIDSVRRGLGSGEALVEYVLYKRVNYKTGKLEPRYRYGAFVLEGKSGKVFATDIGAAESVDAAIARYRTTLENQVQSWAFDETDLAAEGSKLREVLFDRLLPGLGGARRLFIAPAGQISLLPFEALPYRRTSGSPRYMVEDYDIIYLISGRDLARRNRTRSPKPACTRNSQSIVKTGRCEGWLVGNPDYGASPEQVLSKIGAEHVFAQRLSSQQSAGSPPSKALMGGSQLKDPESLGKLPKKWTRLDATATLIDRIANVTRRSGLKPRGFTGIAASEENVLGIKSPRFLLIATHGEFLERSQRKIAGTLRSLTIRPDGSTDIDQNEELIFEQMDPTLNSMLVLAGAEKRHELTWGVRHSGKTFTEKAARALKLSPEYISSNRVRVGDGLLTAYEVWGMDLRGTDLVVLTACETGLGVSQYASGGSLHGIITPGQAVSGFRQAFLVAGGKSLVMSMWPVPEQPSIEQIKTFFDFWLIRKLPRYEAFRSAQLTALKQARSKFGSGHPFWWAGFVYVGDPDVTISR
jgi:CHAT domain-containing protein/tetratricopeptide (TPR) repeat protein